jgi:acetoin utilization deacetylase AcuC-like enzyme
VGGSPQREDTARERRDELSPAPYAPPMKQAALVTDPSRPRLDLAHFYTRHPERPDRLTAILDHLDSTGIGARMTALDARDVTAAEVLSVHDAKVPAIVDDLGRRGGGFADVDTYLTAGSPAAARRAAGGVLVALETVLAGERRRAFAAVRPPGHHATTDTLMGFCLLNNVAIAVQSAFASRLERVAVVDWDVHHGNGTQAIFDADPRLLYVSTHASPFYPGTGGYTHTGSGEATGTMVNIPLPHGAGDEAYDAAYERVVVPALERFAPQLVVVSCGWDGHVRDPLAPLNLTTEGYTNVARQVIEAADTLCGGRLVVALEGGYDEHALAWSAGALCELLLDEAVTPDPEPAEPQSSELPPAEEIDELLDAVRSAVGL